MPSSQPSAPQIPGQLELKRLPDGALVVVVSGRWKLGRELPHADQLLTEIEKGPKADILSFDSTRLSGWDSGLLITLARIVEYCSQAHITVDKNGLPKGVRRLLELAFAVPGNKGGGKDASRLPLLARVGTAAINQWQSSLAVLDFLGEITIAVGRLFTGRAKFRRQDLWLVIQECGVNALPIVSLISILVGLILAFVGSIQLKNFGAQIYIADLVGIAMVRAMGAIMTGIIMAGRTGASFAARIGTMQVNEEVDALQTAGVAPLDFLVLPRIIALSLMMPLLTLYADLTGILGGLIVAVTGFDISFREYYNETKSTMTMTNLGIGLFSSLVFGFLISFCGCLKGMQCGRSASAVGDATTLAVVTGIVSIIVATAIITVVCNVFGI
jgi:phospholipid/cholesterol/gamma-HCH transport system permease protein